MIRNYLKIAWRNLLRHKSFSLINILGLSAGIAACIVIFLYVQYELTYDGHNTKADRIARVVSALHAPGSADMEFGTSPYPMADALKRDFPEVASTARLEPKPTVVKHNGELMNEKGFYQADQELFSVFDYTFLEGTVTGALQQPHSVVLTASTARKYFGKEPALGKTIICDDQPKTVTGVIANPPGNSDIQFTALLYTDYSKKTVWLDDFPVYTFILFNKQPDLRSFERKMKRVADKYCQPELDKADAAGYSVGFALEALADVHFSKDKLEDTPKGNKQFNYIFSLLAIFILVIALLNYINLSTARATERAREVGVRKVNGARPFQLIRQFLFESFLLIAIAWTIAFGIVLVILPYFNSLLQVQLHLSRQGSALFLLCIFVVTILLAGLYPAFILSRFKPVEILKGKWRHSTKGILLRRMLTTAQFVITAALITGTIVIYHQVKYIENKDTGYVKDQVATVHLDNDSLSQRSAPAFINTLKGIPAIKGISAGSGIHSEALSMGTTFAGATRREFMCHYYFIDKELLPLLQIRLKEGRNVSDSLATDRTEAFIVNEAFVEKMGWTSASALGQPMDGYFHKGKVVGVVKNFYYKSLHNMVEPLVMVYNTNPIRAVIIKIEPKDLPLMAVAWKKHFTAKPFTYTFLDEAYKAQYDKDRLTMKLFTYFTVLAILISCLGLYGLVSLMAVQRTKEIGIRKVLGASVQQLVSLLTRDFVKLIILASLIALPVAGMVMHQWLSAYAYHISLAWWMFLLPVVLIILIALAVIGQQVVKAALTNPVHALRNE
ncbi:FtsX-like permease family protein [Pseudoflavitalea sp. X16]|uniref:ABC transporter permease n=1 Tax=Paraflavitalea devenefica TaxID=2716334 RepID=UPI00141E0F3B|nr:ABC transporter permease [Paraflavitalea devenefica]NII25221.1 FtsX-like permease family protein [Paraflavitalea devenefica]